MMSKKPNHGKENNSENIQLQSWEINTNGKRRKRTVNILHKKRELIYKCLL